MASFIEAKYTEQMPFVGTKAQRDLVEAEARRDSISLAGVIRRALDGHFAGRDEELAPFVKDTTKE